MYRSSDHYQVGGTNHNKHNKHCFLKRSNDQSLDLSLSRAKDIKISIISARAVPPSFHMVLSQMGSIS
jgi:hypothetical protein